MDTPDASRFTILHLPIPEKNSDTCDQDISKWRDLISMVDNSVTSIANDLDMIHAAVHTAVEKDESDKKVSDETQPLRNLLMCLERTVLHHKSFSIATVNKCLQIVINTIAQVSGSSVEKFEPLSLDTIYKQSRANESYQGLQNCELENFKRDNSELQLEVSRLHKEMSIIEKKKEGFEDENFNLRKKIKVLEQYNEDLQNRSDISEKSISDLKAELSNVRVENKYSSSNKDKIERLVKENKELTDRCIMLRKEFDEKIMERANAYQKDIDDLRMESDLSTSSVKDKEEEITHLQQYNERLLKENAEKTKEIESNKKEMQNLGTDKNDLETKVKQLSSQYKDVESNSNMEKENDRRKYEVTINDLKARIEESNRLVVDLKDLKRKYENLKQKHDDVKQKLQRTNEEEKILQAKLKDLAGFESKCQEIRKQNINLEEQVRYLTKDKNTLQNKFEKEKQQHEFEAEKRKQLSNEIRSLRTENEKMQANIVNASEQMQFLTNENSRLIKENCDLDEELKMYKCKKLVKVQLYYQRRGELITTVEEELTRILKQRIESTGRFEIEFLKCMTASEVVPDLPLLLLCICASRIGTDAANTIQGLRLTPKVSLLIFHHKDIHALPSQASYQVLTGGEYKTMSGIFDLAFLSGKGIYSCPLNDTSIAKIITFINTEYVQSSSEGLSR
ncbi:girdin-like isoform X2 [Ruditapes philippinarum]|uniref:girdin-like isoform X2 n=1 Tax=Ruditapes philippinarum TaxID=129788 RepID=UPI00295B68B7|nr:girdin-like isoform X2 [Ruditapes philippinarum]